jgi:hypothetical protein
MQGHIGTPYEEGRNLIFSFSGQRLFVFGIKFLLPW